MNISESIYIGKKNKSFPKKKLWKYLFRVDFLRSNNDKIFFSDQEDFEESAPKDFRRLTANQSVGLKYAGLVLSVKKVHKEGKNIKKVEVIAEPSATATKVFS